MHIVNVPEVPEVFDLQLAALRSAAAALGAGTFGHLTWLEQLQEVASSFHGSCMISFSL